MENLSPQEVTQLGEKIYFEKLRSKVEAGHRGEYLVLDVGTENYVIGPDKLSAVNKATQELNGDNLFYIIQIGTLQRPVSNFKQRTYAWTL